MNINSLTGRIILAADGELGKVDEFYFDDRDWQIRYMVAETGNWLLNRKVLIAPAAFKRPGPGSEPFAVALTRDRVRNSPDIDTKKTVSRRHELELHQYYSWPPYWGGGFCAGGSSVGITFTPAIEKNAKTDEEAADRQAAEDPHLRGTRAVTGYTLHATDGPLGRVEDYITDLDGWNIRYLMVDTGLRLPGRKALVSPHWIKSLVWKTSEIFVDLTQEAIRKSPEFDPATPVSEDYQSAIYDHYGRPRRERVR